jgi:short-subunit dehydrogenase
MNKAVAIVTGASQGIGYSTAARLARDFSAVVLVARNKAKLEETAAAVRSAGAESLVIDIDLAEPSAAKQVIKSRSKRSVESMRCLILRAQFPRSTCSR